MVPGTCVALKSARTTISGRAPCLPLTCIQQYPLSGPFMPPANGTPSPGPASLAQRTFTLSAPSTSVTTSITTSARAARRIHVPAEVLKACKIGANDPLLLAGALSPSEIQKRLKIKQQQEADDKVRGSQSFASVL